MFFNIDADDGRVITGWLAPDNPSARPRLAVLVPGREEASVYADNPRPDIRELGLHSTGNVGFSIDASIVAGIEAVDDIEILEFDSRTPIYRRFNEERHLDRKVFLFDSAVMPQRRLINDLGARFALNYLSCERYSLETMIVLINNHFSRSILFYGRSNFNRYAGFLESGHYLRAALLREPFEELAERLLFLSLLGRSEASNLLPTYGTGLMPLVGFARDLPFNDQKALLGAFRQITDEQRQCLMSPMVRMLGCDVDELPTHRNVSLALDHLASMDVVGTRARFDAFRVVLSQLLGASVLGHEAPASFQTVDTLAQTLSRIGIVADLLEQDVTLYSYAERAVATGLAGGEQLAARDTQTI